MADRPRTILQTAGIGYDPHASLQPPGRYESFKQCGPLAQLVEHWTFNPLVIGSIPIRPTINHTVYSGF